MWQGWTMQEWTNQHDVSRVDIAGTVRHHVAEVDNAGVVCNN